MPGMTGPELAAAAARLHPALTVLLMSGYGAYTLVEQAGLSTGTPVLRKPHSRQALADAVRRAIDGLPPSTSRRSFPLD